MLVAKQPLSELKIRILMSFNYDSSNFIVNFIFHVPVGTSFIAFHITDDKTNEIMLRESSQQTLILYIKVELIQSVHSHIQNSTNENLYIYPN